MERLKTAGKDLTQDFAIRLRRRFSLDGDFFPSLILRWYFLYKVDIEKKEGGTHVNPESAVMFLKKRPISEFLGQKTPAWRKVIVVDRGGKRTREFKEIVPEGINQDEVGQQITIYQR